MIIDQVCFAPYGIAFVFTINTFIDGGNINDAMNRLKSEFIETYTANLTIWPIVILFNFWMVPLEYRVLVNNGVGVLWNAYLSHQTHKTLAMAS